MYDFENGSRFIVVDKDFSDQLKNKGFNILGIYNNHSLVFFHEKNRSRTLHANFFRNLVIPYTKIAAILYGVEDEA